MTDLFKKDSAYKSGPFPEEAFQAFKALQTGVALNPLVAHQTVDKYFILTTDAAKGDSKNPGGLGKVLPQIHKDGSEKVIVYASRGLKANARPNELMSINISWTLNLCSKF